MRRPWCRALGRVLVGGLVIVSVIASGPLPTRPGFDAAHGMARCSASDKAELLRGGYSKREIERECAGRVGDNDDDERAARNRQFQGAPGGTPQVARICQTAWGICGMATLVPVGAPCACYMPTGTFPGVAR